MNQEPMNEKRRPSGTGTRPQGPVQSPRDPSRRVTSDRPGGTRTDRSAPESAFGIRADRSGTERPARPRPQGARSGAPQARPDPRSGRYEPTGQGKGRPRPDSAPPRPLSQGTRGEYGERRPTGERPAPYSVYRRPPQKPARSEEGKRDRLLNVVLLGAAALLLALIVIFVVIKASGSRPDDRPVPSDSVQTGPNDPSPTPSSSSTDNTKPPVTDWTKRPSNAKAFVPVSGSSVKTVDPEDLYSDYAILVDLSTGSVISELNPDVRIFPASLTKLMTVIVACENITNMYDTVQLTTEILLPLEQAGASRAYFPPGKDIYMIDLIYGAILPSGADATAGLALKIAGSEKAFVELMNQKAAEMGCYGTHFTNASGLHDPNHYSTVRDLATMMSYAMENPLLRQVLSAKSYKPLSCGGNADGYMYCIWSGRLRGREAKNATLFAAKSGFTDEAKQCLASVSRTADGKEYVIVTARAAKSGSSESRYLPFKDAKYLCEKYLK